jgi:puromycin-sensitive aminopeptidase
MSSGTDKTAGRVLLPDTVLPTRYDLRLAPDLERFSYEGKVSILVEVAEATNEVRLHAKELQLKMATFKPAEGSPVEVETITHIVKDTIVSLTFAEILPVGSGVLEIDFVGTLNDQMAGFYRSGYQDINGKEKIMASTQFESLDARRCFPCWDEPARKAVFAVTLVVDPRLTAFSNMPEKCSKLVKVGSKVEKHIDFMDSPKMSTYLLAFVVGEFDFVQAKTDHGVLVRVYTPPGRSEAGHFPLGVATKCLDIYDDFFGVPYPLPKLDMVAIPEFAAGAMENWGCVTYRECDLLIDAKTASGQQKQRVCIVVTHELAHQWFGNLVTMTWWDDLWLNEGFASWCENYAADLIFPDYQIWPQFGADTMAAALRLDALKTSHPIQVPIARAEEVEEVFDAISYCKGASVIRMAHAVLGHDKFRNGLRQYMQKHQYSNTETLDLWNAWESASGMPVKDLMASWTEQMGFPVVTVTSFEVVGSAARLKLKQTWFLSSGEQTDEKKTWNVPVFMSTSSSTAPKLLTIMKEETLVLEDIPLSGSADFVLLNSGVFTPMRVAYTPEMRSRLIKALKAGLIQPADRACLVLDTFALAKAGMLAADEALRFLLVGFAGETHYVVVDALSAALAGFQKILMGSNPEIYKLYLDTVEQFVRKCWEAANVGWERLDSDGHLTGLLREALMSLVAKFAPGASWLQEATRRFGKYVEDPQVNATELPDEYRAPVLQAVLQNSGEAEFRKVMDTYKKLRTNVEQKHIYEVVGFTREPKLKSEVLRWAISGDVKAQDFFYVMRSVSASTREGLDMTWDFYKSNFDSIHKFVKAMSPSIMDAAISVSIGGFCSEEAAKDVEKFFDDHPLPSNKRKISQTLEEIRSNAGFAQRALATDVAKAEFWKDIKAAVASAVSPEAKL